MYSPSDVGKIVMNGHGKLAKIRKYHMTDKEMERGRKKWEKVLEHINIRTSKKAGTKFFNPYRKGVYYYQIYAMFLLGANQWHSLSDIIRKMEHVMSPIIVKDDGISINLWDKFRGKTGRKDAVRCKDHIGRVQENMIFFQRLAKLHPYGYKLRQVCSAIDIKRTTVRGFPNGKYHYRLSTYGSTELSLPMRDYSGFIFPRHERKYVSYKFIGTIITHDRVIEGKKDEVSQV